MGPEGIARTKALATVGVLILVLAVGVTWAWAAVTEPFPEQAPTPDCDDISIDAGQPLRPGSVTVSVLNAGGQEGLARQTMDDLVTRGFDEGELANAPDDADVARVQVWTTERNDPAVRLVRSYLGRDVPVVRRDGGEPGINVVVGPGFAGTVKGYGRIVVKDDTTVCGPVVTE